MGNITTIVCAKFENNPLDASWVSFIRRITDSGRRTASIWNHYIPDPSDTRDMSEQSEVANLAMNCPKPDWHISLFASLDLVCKMFTYELYIEHLENIWKFLGKLHIIAYFDNSLFYTYTQLKANKLIFGTISWKASCLKTSWPS